MRAIAQKGYILDLLPAADVKIVLTKIEVQTGCNIQSFHQVSSLWNIWYLELDKDTKYASGQIVRIELIPEVEQFQSNHAINLRKDHKMMLLPNDMLLGQQWSLINAGTANFPPDVDIDAEEAWEVTTGGNTASGDTIVVAIIDSGFGDHPDLEDNLWFNNKEIPNDLLDNDQNGFIDDYEGWNVFSQNDDIQGVSINHGTAVAGIIGAKGNNSNGISGINWAVKMMCVTGGNTEADIISAYDYIGKARKRYNETNGSDGAFVTVINCSFGIDYGQPSESPIWCSVFDSLGQVGILSVAATTNNSINIDLLGDLPTTCPSDYLISVTNLDRNNLLAEDAGWGSTHVDLGAYGENIFSTKGISNYDWHSGTSFAAPHVSGAAALLYSAPCPDLVAQAKYDPSGAALRVKELILGSVESNPSLTDVVATAGVLNLKNLINQYQNTCANCPAPFTLAADSIGLTDATLNWMSIAPSQSAELRFRLYGNSVWIYEDDVQPDFLLESLLPCSQYEFSVRAICSDSTSSIWSFPFLFVTDGCCQIPTDIEVTGQSVNSISIAWPEQSAATKYSLLIRKAETIGGWQYFETLNPYFTFTDLLTCQIYDIQVQSHCGSPIPPFSNVFQAQTSGCGACFDAEYCMASGSSTIDEWIQTVIVGSWLHDSGEGGSGYENFNTISEPVLKIFSGYTSSVVLIPGFSGQPHKEYFKIFIDFNLDGDFDDNGELACDPGFAHDDALNATLNSPLFSLQGFTRMRVVMQYYDNNSSPLACGAFGYGQVEDYCVFLEPSSVSTTEKTPQPAWKISPVPTHDYIYIEGDEPLSPLAQINILSVLGNVVDSPQLNIGSNNKQVIAVGGLIPGIYILQIRQGSRVVHMKFIKS